MQRLSFEGRAQDVRLSRRAFVAALAVPMVAAACSRRPYRRSDFSLPQRSVVELLPASSYNEDFADLIGRGLRDLGVAVQGRRVLLKPNMVEYQPGTASAATNSRRDSRPSGARRLEDNRCMPVYLAQCV